MYEMFTNEQLNVRYRTVIIQANLINRLYISYLTSFIFMARQLNKAKQL